MFSESITLTDFASILPVGIPLLPAVVPAKQTRDKEALPLALLETGFLETRRNELSRELLLKVGGVQGMTQLLLFHLSQLTLQEKHEHANRLIRKLLPHQSKVAEPLCVLELKNVP